MFTVALFFHRTTALSSLSSTTATRSYSSSSLSWPCVKSKRSTSERHVSHADIIHALASYIDQINGWNALTCHCNLHPSACHCSFCCFGIYSSLRGLLCICRETYILALEPKPIFYLIPSPSWHPGFTHLPLCDSLLHTLCSVDMSRAAVTPPPVIFHSWPLSSMLHGKIPKCHITGETREDQSMSLPVSLRAPPKYLSLPQMTLLPLLNAKMESFAWIVLEQYSSIYIFFYFILYQNFGDVWAPYI